MARTHFDAVIVGSGFGGSVVSYRLAEAGLEVCLIERGQAYPPGSFPRTPQKMKRNVWDPSEGLYGMFDLWSFDGIDALISSALGGGSIIYANVLIRKDADWFVRENLSTGETTPWPVDREELDPHYDRVEEILNAQRYPFDEAPYDQTPKTQALKQAAEQLGLDWHRPNLAVTFANDGEPPVPGEPIEEEHGNLHGRTRTTCRLCGECDIGCNYGSKNTLDYNYLSAAERHGADIRTLCEVRSFAPRGDGYDVGYVEHDLDRAGESYDTDTLPVRTITTDRLILSAGTLGSTYLLLKNRDALPGLSPRLGDRFCGNGDFLSFALDAEKTDPQTGETVPRVLDPNEGPVITSTIRVGDALDAGTATGRGFYIQDAGYPVFLSWLYESADLFGTVRRLVHTLRQFVTARVTGDTNLSAEVRSLIGGERSATALPLLGMGRDRPTGTFTLQDGLLATDWRVDESRTYFDRLADTMKAIAEALGADFLANPTWLLDRVVTVHPLGGCPMGRTPDRGVVNEFGEVHNHPNLYVADGSILPGPVGPNPALTIAAVADRIADHIIEEAPRAADTTQ